MNKENKFNLIKIIIAVIFLVIAFLVNDNEILHIVFNTLAYLIVGYDILLKAIFNIFKGKLFDENFLMSIATVGAFILKDYEEAVAVMLLYQIGELFQSYSVNKSRRSIEELMKIREENSNVLFDGTLMKIPSKDVKVDQIIVVKPGERIPLDGIVISGNSNIDVSMLSGESKYKVVKENEEILSGCINLTSVLEIKVTKEYKDTTVSKILDLTLEALDKKSKTQKYISKFARYYTPIVVIGAVILALIPPIILNQDFMLWVRRSLTFLVISCPCALVISVPLSFFGGIGGASRKGILIKGSNYIETLSKVDTIVFDKTGTLTYGNFKVSKIYEIDEYKNELLKIAAHAQYYSNHPIAVSIKEEYKGEINIKNISDFEEIAGHGIKVNILGLEICIGNKKLMDRYNIVFEENKDPNTCIYVSINNSFVGYIIISDIIKKESCKVIKELQNLKKEIVILTGDNKAVALNISKTLNVDKVYYELLPVDKVDKMKEIMKNKSKKHTLAFVGDGINDAPALALSDVGIAMGVLGSDAAIEASDVVIMDDDLTKINKSIKISKKTMRIVRQNIYMVFLIKLFFLILAAFGQATMWEAVIADVGVSFLAIINAMRPLKK